MVQEIDLDGLQSQTIVPILYVKMLVLVVVLVLVIGLPVVIHCVRRYIKTLHGEIKKRDVNVIAVKHIMVWMIGNVRKKNIIVNYFFILFMMNK